MAVIATQLTSGADGTDGTTFTTASVTPTANKLQLIGVTAHRSGDLPSDSITVTGCNLTWVQIATNTTATSGSSSRVVLYRALGASPTTGTLTITTPETSTRCLWSLTEFDNIDTTGTNGSGAIVQSATARNAAVDLATLVVTLAAFGDVNNATFGFVGTSDVGTIVDGAGFTELANVAVEAGDSEATWRNDNDTSVDWTWVAADSSAAGVAVEIKFAAATTTSTSSSTSTTSTSTSSSTSTTSTSTSSSTSTTSTSSSSSTSTTSTSSSTSSSTTITITSTSTSTTSTSTSSSTSITSTTTSTSSSSSSSTSTTSTSTSSSTSSSTSTTSTSTSSSSSTSTSSSTSSSTSTSTTTTLDYHFYIDNEGAARNLSFRIDHGDD